MALSIPTINGALRSSAPDFLGPTFLQLSGAISTAIYTWAITPSNILVSGTTSGVAGAGISTGFLTVPPNVAGVIGVFTSFGIVGPNGLALARVLGTAIPIAFASAQYTGPSIGVSAGVDISKIVSVNPATLTPILTSSMSSFYGGPIGPTSLQLAPAISASMSLLLLAGFTTPGTGIVVPGTSATGTATGVSPTSAIF